MGYIIVHEKLLIAYAMSSKEPVTLEHLAEVEINMMKMLDALEEKLLTKESEDDRKNKKD